MRFLKTDIKDVYIRNILRILAALVLFIWVYDISKNKIKNGKIYMDVNDGYVILGCFMILLAIQGVKLFLNKKLILIFTEAVRLFLRKRLNNFNNLNK